MESSGRSLLGRLCRAYLILTSFLYLLNGLVGILPDYDFIGSVVWDSGVVIRPFPLFPLLEHFPYSHSIYGFLYNSSFEPNSGHFRAFSLGVVVISIAAVWAGFALRNGSNIANFIWICFVSLSLLAAFANISADLADWGVYPYKGGDVSVKSIIFLCLAISYTAAYVLAARGGATTRKPAVTASTQ